jgi:DNA-binding SARP family transcriptional activator
MPESTPSVGKNSLRIYLLGSPLVEWAGETLDIPRRHVRGLFYHLAAQRTPVPRERLSFLCWPDIPEAAARRNLTRVLTHLRRALPLPQVLIAHQDVVGLEEGSFWCDALETRRLAEGGPAADALQRIVALYRGPFLDGFYLPGCLEFERWMSQERAALENTYLEALSGLIEAKTAANDYAVAILYARRYLETNELTEEVHRRLISLYALIGDRTRALRQFEECVSILERELGVDPLPETRGVYQSVLEDRPPKWRSEYAPAVEAPWSKHLRLDVPLIGRSSVIHHLDRALLQAKAGQSKVVLISGEPGVGKSRLLHDFAAHCHPHSRALFGAGYPGELSIPYHPIVEALHSAAFSAPFTLPSPWLAEVARLLPELHATHPGLPPPFSLRGAEARIRLFEALCQFIFALETKSGPILLCFDDLHWFDQTSLGWLMYLCRQLTTQRSRVMIIGTYRAEDADQVTGLRDSLARLSLLDEIRLVGLDETHIVELVRHVLGDLPGNGTFALKLREATGGNPFFILETLLALKGEERLSGDTIRSADLPLPTSVREAVGRRLGRLSPRSRQVLEAGAVLGSRFGFEVIRLTAGRSELETSLALEALVNRQLLGEEGKHYRFVHDLIRRVTIASISPVRLRILHSRAGKALKRFEPEAVTALAHHFDTAGEWEKALHYHDLSARHAEGLHAWLEAESHLDRMLELLALLDPQGTQTEYVTKRSQFLSRLAQLHYLQGRLVERDADLERLDELARAIGKPQLELHALLMRAQHHNNDARYGDAIIAAEAGLALADQLDDTAGRARLLAQIGLGHLFLGQPVQALAALQGADSAMEEVPEGDLRALVLSYTGQAYSVLGDYRHALDCRREAFAHHQESGDHYGAARQVEIGFLLTKLGRLNEAGWFLEESLAQARKAGVRIYEAHALLAWGGLHLCQGDPTAAIDCYQRALEMFGSWRNRNLSASATTAVGFAFYHLGDLAKGREWLERGLEAARSIGHRMRASEALIQLAMLETSAGRVPSARAAALDGLAIAREIRGGELISAGLSIAARIERIDGVPDKARGYAGEALHHAQQFDLLALEMLARVELGLALAELGRLGAAGEHTSAAVTLIPRAHQYWIAPEQVHLAHAKVLKRAGEGDAAEEQEHLADAIIQAKAARISDLTQRDTFLSQYPRSP